MRNACTIVALLFVLLVPACGGGGDGGGNNALALLNGSWAGRCFDGPGLRLVFDGQGNLLQVFEDDVDTGLTGSIVFLNDGLYRLTADGQFNVFVDASGEYLALFGESALCALQRGTDDGTLPVLADVAPATYQGSNFILAGDGSVTDEDASEVQIFADGSYDGSNQNGLLFGSVALGDPLAPLLGGLVGSYEDTDHASVGFIDVAASPDRQFLVAASYPEFNTTITSSAFVAAWKRD